MLETIIKIFNLIILVDNPSLTVHVDLYFVTVILHFSTRGTWALVYWATLSVTM